MDAPTNILKRYRAQLVPIHWDVENGAPGENDPAVKYRNGFAHRMAASQIGDILKRYTGMTPSEMDELVAIARTCSPFQPHPFSRFYR